VLDVLRRVGVELRRAVRERGELIADGGQRLPRHLDLGGGVDRDRLGGGDDRRHRLADVADGPDRQRVVLPPAPRRRLAPTTLGARSPERDRLAGALDVLARDDARDPRPRQRAARVDAPDPRVRVRAPDEGDVLQPRHRDVADVGGGARDESGIFLALDFGAHQTGSGGGHARGSFRGSPREHRHRVAPNASQGTGVRSGP
jgi:hypothetical protein